MGGTALSKLEETKADVRSLAESAGRLPRAAATRDLAKTASYLTRRLRDFAARGLQHGVAIGVGIAFRQHGAHH